MNRSSEFQHKQLTHNYVLFLFELLVAFMIMLMLIASNSIQMLVLCCVPMLMHENKRR